MTILTESSLNPKRLSNKEIILLASAWGILLISGFAAFYLRATYFDWVAFSLALKVMCAQDWLIHAWLLPFIFSGTLLFVLATILFVHLIPYLPTKNVKFMWVGLIGLGLYLLPSELFGIGFQGYFRVFLTLRCAS